MSKERFDLPPYMIGIDNDGMIILTTFVGEAPTNSLRMNRDSVLRLIQILSVSIGANIKINKIAEVEDER